MGRRAVGVTLAAFALSLPVPAAASMLDAAAARKAPTATVVATVTVPQLAVYTKPDAPEPKLTLSNPTATDGQLVVLVKDINATGWMEVLLPVRPNGSTGWIRATDVLAAPNPFRIVIDLSDHRLTLLESGKRVLREPTGIGKANTPTPGGEYFVTQLFAPDEPDGPYGPYAYALSGFSEVLTTFQGGDAIIGIHGTNKPDLVGQDVSSGCIRVKNDVITKIAEVVPLGTPVDIRK